ncbi:MAG: hypothetical protein GZ089_11245 [Aromatoleum sp.]|nr:hypothetical protein [Aromatoleum sp.]
MRVEKILPRTAIVNVELTHEWTVTGAKLRDPALHRSFGPPISEPKALMANFRSSASEIEERHRAQTLAAVLALREKYRVPVLGRVPVWTAIEMLAQCIDPTDLRLFGASQQLHVLQILDAMENEGAASEEFVLAALLHDLGKVLLLAGEAPENVVCFNEPIGTYAPGIGLDRCVLQWNHDEFAYSRLKDHLPDGVAWLVRYHSIALPKCEPYLDARDRAYVERYFRPFARYDHGTKSPYHVPRRRIQDYRSLIERTFPSPIVI